MVGDTALSKPRKNDVPFHSSLERLALPRFVQPNHLHFPPTYDAPPGTLSKTTSQSALAP